MIGPDMHGESCLHTTGNGKQRTTAFVELYEALWNGVAE